jgi:HAE1 family hydrophobic/amphiphilic exporter-1
VVISAFVALTLTPTMAARILKPHAPVQHGRCSTSSSAGFEHFQSHYERLLRWALSHRRVVVLASLAIFGLTAWIYTRLDKSSCPRRTRGAC